MGTNPFVNLKKRGVTLPPGCKDLIDMLRPAKGPTTANEEGWSATIIAGKTDTIPADGLAQVEKYVSRVIHSPARTFTLLIKAQKLASPVGLYRDKQAQVFGICLSAKDELQEQAIRALFDHSGVQAMFEEMSTLGAFTKRLLVYRLPYDVARVTSLMTEVLRNVYELDPASGIEFTIYEER